jgi:hypothetical protein
VGIFLTKLFHLYTHSVRHCYGTIWRETRLCWKWLPLCKGFVKPFHSRKSPLAYGGKFPKSKDHCLGLLEWLHLLIFLPTNPIDTLLLRWKASANTLSLCWVITQSIWGAWLVLNIPTLSLWWVGSNLQSPNCMSCLPYHPKNW